MRLRKIVASLLAVTLLMGMCAGCEKNKGNGKTQISIAGWPDKDLDPSAYARYEDKKSEFESMYPDLELVPDSWDYEASTFMARAEGGELSTVYSSFMTEADKIIKFGYASDITDYLKKYGYYDKINPSLLDTISKDERIYLLPKDAYALGLFVNVKLFKEAGLVNADGSVKIPKTFNDVAEFSQIIKEKTGKAGFVFPTTSNQGGWNFTMLAWNFGTKFIEQVEGKWVAKFDSQECADALNYLKNLMWDKKVLPQSTNIDSNEVMKLVGTEQVAMAIVHPLQLDVLLKNYAMDAKDIAMVTMPAGPKRHVTLMGGSYYVIDPNATPEEIDGAFKWIKYNGLTTEMSEDEMNRYESDLKSVNEENSGIIGIKNLSIWNDNSETEKFKNEMMEKYRNIPVENVADFNNNKDSVEYQVEEAVCAQELYGVLDSCIQEVLTNKDSDALEILKSATKDFQADYLDHEN